MELLFIIILAIILAETTLLTVKALRKTNFGSKKPRRKLFVDTSALIDGRILSVAQAGFLGDEVLIPRSVIRELQLLADGSDSEKRSRARFGMDVANELERVVSADVEIFHDELDRTKVDERLIELAKEHKGMILTNDFNLGKVAATEGIEVLNVNDLAKGLRSEFLPGERFKLKISTRGNNARQGVGYISDGTMVVVDDAEKLVGKEVEVELVRYLQTNAGKMMFGRLTNKRNTTKNNSNNNSKRTSKR
ncbi:MAG: PIN/TRAM domain-containing protein [Candidatus Saccharimonadales bacterium]